MPRPAEHQVAAGPGDADVANSPFLFETARICNRPLVREQPVFHAGHKYDRKLQALCGMGGHQGDAVISLVIGVQVGHDCHLIEQALQLGTLVVNAEDVPGYVVK